MYKNKTITAILPCRNEGTHLAQVIAKIPKVVDEIIVVSNRSTDDTVMVARQLGVCVIEDDRALNGIGYGFAHISGIQAAKGDVIVGIDGDATYPIEEVTDMIDHLVTKKLDFLSCNRYPLKDGTSIPLKLRLGVYALNLEVWLLYGVHVKDILSGMWVFRRGIRSKLALTMGDWNLSPQIKLNAATNPEIRFGEYHIMQHRREGETKQHYLSTGFSHMKWILANRVKQIRLPIREKYAYIYRFAAVGAVAFFFNYLLLAAIETRFGLGKVVSESLAMACSLQLTFFLHDRWTYVAISRARNYKLSFVKRYASYLASNVFGSLITIGLFGAFSHLLPRFEALAVAALAAMVWNFMMNKIVIWRHKSARRGSIVQVAEESE